MQNQPDTPLDVVRAWPDQARERFLTFEAVASRVGLGRTAIYAGIKEKTFPAPVKYGARSLWPESEVEAWIEGLKSSRTDHG